MSAIRVLTPGFLTTVQDLGRFGQAHLGISASGAADPLAIRAGNLLVGNAENAAALEMTLAGGEFEFEADAVVALTGSDFGADLPQWAPVPVTAGQKLRLGPTRTGARAYLCVRGGIDVPRTLGSASAHLLTGVGGGPLRGAGVRAQAGRGIGEVKDGARVTGCGSVLVQLGGVPVQAAGVGGVAERGLVGGERIRGGCGPEF